MRRSDIIVALVIGELTALLSLVILKNFGLELLWFYFLGLIISPLSSLLGLWIAYLLAKKFKVFWQLAKFMLVGGLNTFVDLGVLNILILITGIASGFWYSIFKAVSFSIAVINSYFWNKLWTFSQVGKTEAKESGRQFIQFLIISVIGFGINVGVASLVVNIIGPQFNLSPQIWANIGAFIATFIAMTWNFLGYKFIVFKSKS